MSNLQAFMLKKEDRNKVVERELSKRYLDEHGNPLKFKFKAISPNRDAQLKAECTKKTPITQGKRKGQMDTEFLSGKYQNLLIIESMIEPDLNSKELQDFYEVFGAEDLFDVMFNAGEVTEAFLGAQEANGYEIDFADLVEEAKN